MSESSKSSCKSFYRLYSITQASWLAVFLFVSIRFGWRYLLLILIGQVFINASLGFIDGIDADDKFALASRFLIFINVLVPLEAFIILLIMK